MALIPDLPLARFEVDRAAHVRADKEWLEKAWASNDTRILVLQDGNLPVTDDLSLIWVKPTALEMTVDAVRQHAVLLGVQGKSTYIAIVDDFATIEATAWVHLRAVGAKLSAHDVGLATTAIAINAWHRTHKFCTRCGQPTTVTSAGWSRHCAADNSEHYPRTEPAMIIAVNDEHDRVLLGRRHEWTEGWFSTLAGFVESGESAEACVLREVYEEAGVHVDPTSLKYLGSQPWPYPASLMLGYRAVATTTDIRIEDAEMADVRWFTREEFVSQCEEKTLQLPNRTTIAFHLIQDWFGAPIPDEWTR